MMHPLRVLICGSGGSAHVLAAVFSSRPETAVSVLTLDPSRAAEWQRYALAAPMQIYDRDGVVEPTHPATAPLTITSDPALAARGCDMIVFAIPAFLHEHYLVALAPYVEQGTVLVGLPGQAGFEFEVRCRLGRIVDRCVLMNFDSLPWVCRTVEFGRSVQVSGTKETLVGALQGDTHRSRIADPTATLQRLLGESPRITVSGHLLGISLRSPNAYSHPPILYGRWKDWDRRPLAAPPLFYHGIDHATAALLEDISSEVVAISRQLMRILPGTDLTQVVPMLEWDVSCYGHDIAEASSLWSALRTNAGYAGIVHPMREVAPGCFIPEFNHRFLNEDVPFGLVVIRSIAEIAGVPTPRLDEVLVWCQEKMGKEYLVNGSLTGRDIAETRSAHRYGLTTPEEILGLEPALTAGRAR